MEESILTVEQMAELNPEGIEVNTVVADESCQDTFNTDTIEALNDGEFEVENVEEVEVEEAETEDVEEAVEETVEEVVAEVEGE